MKRIILAFALTFVVTSPARAIDIQEVVSDGGLTAWLVEENSIPFTALEIRFEGGGSLDRPGKRGAIHLLSGLFDEGAGDLDARAFAAARDDLAASYQFDAYRDAVTISARFLTENRDEAVSLLRSAIQEPRFDQDAIDRVREQVLSNIRFEEVDSGAVAWNEFIALTFGDHPYGTNMAGTEESVLALSRDDLVAAHKDTLALDRVFISAAGDISADELAEIIDTLLLGLPATGAPLPGRADVQLEGGVTVVPFDTPQSVARFAHAGLRIDDPDFFAAFVANEIFGGAGRQSRLSDEVREKRGLTYGVGAHLATFDHAELVLGQLASANDRMAEAIEVIRAEWEKIASEGVTAKELAEAKTYLTGAYPLRFDSNASIARILVGMQMDGRPIDYADTRNDRIKAVTLEDIQRVAKRLYRPEDLRFVVVGQPVGLESVN